MKRIISHGGITFLIIAMNGLFYYLDGRDILEFIDTNKRKSIPLSYIEEKGYIINKKIRPRIDYIEVLDNIYFKE